jgi:thiamine biosynthesis lipoprotein
VLANLSGIAKGYGVDRASAALDALGIGDYMVEVGGEIRTRGLNGSGQPWQLAIEQPDAMPQRAFFIVPLSGLSLATSGDYRIYFMHRTALFARSASQRRAGGHAWLGRVVADNCALADAWSTALFVLGPSTVGLPRPRPGGVLHRAPGQCSLGERARPRPCRTRFPHCG